MFKRLMTSVAGLLAFAVVVIIADAWTAFGKGATGARRERMEHSPQWKDGHFDNPQPLHNDHLGSVTAMFYPSPDVNPLQPVPTISPDPKLFASEPASGLRVTWMGHSTLLVELDGHRILTDPVWSERASPLSWAGPKRWYVPPIPLEELPSVDAVVISHDHYDHLDQRTLTAMKDWKTKFIVPLGVGAHLEYWGVPVDKIVEVDWWDRTSVGDMEIVCAPARHASGRTLIDMNATLWAGYAFISPKHRVFYSGDTGLFPGMKDIGERLGPFDIVMIEVGQYHSAWPDWHLGPEQAVMAHQMLQGRVMLPVHWGLFPLAVHGWTEPMERVLAATSSGKETVVTPEPGELLDLGANNTVRRWWPNVSWHTGAQDPIVATPLN